MRQTIYFLFFVLLLCSVAAAPPFQSSEAKGLTIIYPKNEYFAVNTSSDLHFHVYNSTGYLLTNATTSCYIHIYNGTNMHIAQSNLSFDVNGVDFEYTLNSSLIMDRGIYPFLVECKSNVESGYISTSFTVTTDGEEPKAAGAPLAVIILLPMLFGFILLFAAIHLNEDHALLREILFFLMPICFWVSLHIGIVVVAEFYVFPPLQDIIGDTAWWSGLLFWLLIGYYALYLIYKLFTWMLEGKKEKAARREAE